jgi:DNA-binding NtrC family response regulator
VHDEARRTFVAGTEESLTRVHVGWRERASRLAREVRRLTDAGALDRASALVASETVLAGRPLGRELASARAWLRLWQGRGDEARHDLPRRPRTADDVWLAGLVAWAELDRRALTALTRASRRDPAEVTAARRVIALLSAAIDDDASAVTAMLHDVARLTRSASPSTARWTRLVAAEALVTVCRTDRVSRALGPPRLWADATTLERRVRDRLQAASRSRAPDNASPGRASDDLPGLMAWGEGSEHMHLLRTLPDLLQLFQEAEDDLAALRAGCAWARRAAGADRIAFTVGEDVVACAGWPSPAAAGAEWRTRSTHGVVHTVDPRWIATPVRYAGAAVGLIVADGADAARGRLADALGILAALAGPALRARRDALVLERQAVMAVPEILGASPAIAAIREAIARAAGTPFPVLVEGESGTGKELMARAIHRLSPRRDRPFRALNCAALSDDLFEAELFGHTRGAFTGAVTARMGLFEAAHGGSLFLDEVGDLSARAQAKLLRVLQEGEIRRVGENATRAVDVRIIAATNQPLARAVARGAFREDLLFRLAVVRLQAPALRDRLEDVPCLAQAFWRRLVRDTDRRATLSPSALSALCHHRWPGNVRELQNVVSALVVAAPGRGSVGARDVYQVLGRGAAATDAGGVSLDRARLGCERRVIAAALARHGGRRSAAARELGLSRQGLAKAMRRLGLGRAPQIAGVA